MKKGYKKKALQTHPDKLPANATAEAKRQAEEQFRLVSNAYEVLRDQGNRQLYDLHGVWPPPQAGRSSNRGPSASTPFPPDQWPFNGQQPFFGDQRSNAQYTDPFMFFDSIFRDVFPAMHHGHFSHNHQHDHHHDPTFSFHTGPHHRHRHISSLGRGNAPGMFGDAFMNDPFFNNANAASNPFGPGFPFGNMFPSVVGGMSSSASTTFTNSGNRRGRWMSESRSTVISNGQKTSTWERLDQEGRKHVTRTYPDGRETYHINGVEQQPQLASAPTERLVDTWSYRSAPHSPPSPPEERRPSKRTRTTESNAQQAGLGAREQRKGEGEIQPEAGQGKQPAKKSWWKWL